MLTEIQKIILTCLLGPEDKTAFARIRKNALQQERRAKDPLHKERAREEERKRRLRDPEKVKLASNTWKLEHPEETSLGSRAWKFENQETCREYRTGANRNSYLDVRRKTNQLRYKNDPSYRLECCLRSRLTTALTRVKGAKKSASTMELTGCPLVWLEVHLESLFRSGMTLENYGSVWQIDHIKPCAAFNLTDPEQQRICFHWTNLQPLFAEENLKKGDTYVLQ